MSFDQNPRDDEPVTPTRETVGNFHGYLCPKCKQGNELSISAHIWTDLTPEGCDNSDSDTEWDHNSSAMCGNCEWDGKVSDLLTVEVSE